MKKIISTVLICVLLLGCVFVLASCGAPNDDPEEAKAALEEEGYSVTLNTEVPGMAATITAFYNNIKDRESDYVEIYYFNSEDDANAAWETVEAVYAAEAEKLKGTDYEIDFGIDGKVIYKGTVNGVKAAK